MLLIKWYQASRWRGKNRKDNLLRAALAGGAFYYPGRSSRPAHLLNSDMDKKAVASLKRALDELYHAYDFRDRVKHDPISIPNRFRARSDREAVGFLATALSYGKVDLFLGVIERLLGKIGNHPADFMAQFQPKRDLGQLNGIKYRFNETEDIAALLYATGRLLKKFGSLEAVFMKHYRERHPDIGPALAGLMGELNAVDTTPVYGGNIRPMGYRYFLPSPASGSACKRSNLFLRWMVRRADIDFGLWTKVSPAKLVIPLDRHIARVSRCLGFTKRKSDNWKTALEITDSLRTLDPADPLRYDFALCHRGITGLCAQHMCEGCELGSFRPQ
jgi:uncharacterized protein (TIGR02757 family)